MSKKQIRTIKPFFGLMTSADAADIPDGYASDLLNVRTEDGQINSRYGFRNLGAAPNPFTAFRGFDYVAGYDTNNAEVEEFIAIQEISGAVKPYSVNPSTWARTEITNSGVGLNLHASDWKALTFQEHSYHFNPNSIVYRHVIGNNSSFKPLTPPTAPAAAPTYTVTYGHTEASYARLSFTGVHMTNDVVYSGAAVNNGFSVVNADGTMRISHTATATTSSVEITLNGATGPGLQDWYDNDIFYIQLASTGSPVFRIDPASVIITFTNDAGTVFTPSMTVFPLQNNPQILGCRLHFLNKTRTDWGNDTGTGKIRKIKIEYRPTNFTGTGPTNYLTISRPIVGGVDLQTPYFREPGSTGINIVYTHYNSTDDFESGRSPDLFIPRAVLFGSQPANTVPGLGIHLRINTVASADASVTHNRYYVSNASTGDLHRIASVADSTLNWTHKLTYEEVLRLPTYTLGTFKNDKVLSACAHKGSVVWCYDFGYQNVRFSRVGEPEKLANPLDIEEDFNRGATYSLADNYDDKALAVFSVGDAVIFCGAKGTYAMVGDLPSTMTFPKKIPGTSGIPGQFAACKWADDDGNPGVAVIDRNSGALNFIQVGNNFDGANGFRITELSSMIRGTLRSFLVDGQSALSITDFSGVRMAFDESNRSLWTVLGKRAVVWRRPALMDGNRQWELYEYNTGGSSTQIKYLAFSSRYRQIWARSTGEIDENEWNSSTRSYITGTNRDAGNAIGSIYWQSKKYLDVPRRISHVLCERGSKADTPTITVISDRQTTSLTLTANKDAVKFGALQQGRNHQFKIAITENSSAVKRLEVEEHGVISRRWTA